MNDEQNDSKPKEKKPKFNFYWIYGVLALVFIGLQLLNFDSATESVDKGKLIMMLQNQDVQKIDLVNKEIAEIFLKPESRSRYIKEEKSKGIASNLGSPTPDFTFQIG